MKAFLLFFITSPLFAATPIYDMQLRVSINGKVTAPRIIAREGQTTTAYETDENGNKTFVEATASEYTDKMVMMNFKVGTVDANGKKTILSTPKMATMENESAAVTQVDTKTGEKLSVGVIFSRQ